MVLFTSDRLFRELVNCPVPQVAAVARNPIQPNFDSSFSWRLNPFKDTPHDSVTRFVGWLCDRSYGRLAGADDGECLFLFRSFACLVNEFLVNDLCCLVDSNQLSSMNRLVPPRPYPDLPGSLSLIGLTRHYHSCA
jgi:hypothetical protein